MKYIFLLLTLIMGVHSYGQGELKISTLDFVEVLNDNHDEALFFYKNNWKKLREIALKKDISALLDY